MKRVLVALSADSIAAREMLVGMFNYVNSGHDWNVRLLEHPNAITPELLSAAIRSGIDGVITGASQVTSGFLALLKADIPTALTNFPPQHEPKLFRNLTIVHNDDVAIGRLGARTLRAAGQFSSYVFVPTVDKTWWSTYRQRGFRLELAKHKIIPLTFRGQSSQLGDWLKGLRKPIAILAATDLIGSQVIECCQRFKITIPHQATILGVDNDEIICSGTRPTLSSIHPNHVEMARRAAQELDVIMAGRKRSSEAAIFIPPIGVIERESTKRLPPAGHLILEGQSFIRKNYMNGIKARDVIRHLHVSESLARLRFQTILGHSISDEILGTQLKEAKRLLAGSGYSVSAISRAVGFSSANWFAHYFKNQVGVAPGVWRKRGSTRAGEGNRVLMRQP